MGRKASAAAQIKRVVKAAKTAGMAFVRVEIDGEKITVTEIAAPTLEPQNDLDRWRAKHARQA